MKGKQSILPRFGVSTVDGNLADIDNLQCAATIFAFDVPLNETKPYTTQSGDGFSGVRVVWHFQQTDGAGNSPKSIAKHFMDRAWCDANPGNPLAVCRRAFDELSLLKTLLETGRGLPFYAGPGVRITNTRKAAVIKALGHPLKGWLRNSQVTTWCFPEAAAADAALYDDPDLYRKLPDSAISYARGAILGHEAMIAQCKTILQAVVTHKGRTAIIGKDAPKALVDSISKLLYRK